MLIAQVNLWAVLLGAVSNMVLGYLWYGAFFGKKWMTLMGIADKEITPEQKKEGNKAMSWGVLVALVTSYVLANLITYFSLSLMQSLQFAGLIWLGFVATSHANNSIFEDRKWGLYTIGVSYQLAALLLMATIIVLVR